MPTVSSRGPKKMSAYTPAYSERPLGEKLRGLSSAEVLDKPQLKDAWSLGEKLRLANPATANKPKTTEHRKAELAQLDLVKILKTLGTTVNGVYVKDPNCLLALRHMARHLREDRNSDKLTVRLHLVSSGVIKTNLLPMLLESPEDDKLWQLCLNVMYDLTIPPAVIIKAIPKDLVEDSHCLKMYLHEYEDKRQVTKKLFMDRKFFHLLCSHIKKILKNDEPDRDQINFVGNSLRLLRNIFEMRGEINRGVDSAGPALVHDKVFCALDESGITTIMLWLSSADVEENFVLDVLEVLHALLYDFDPEALGRVEKTEADVQEDQATVRKLREREAAVRKANALSRTSRHSSFGGSFTVKGSRAVNPDKEIVLLQPISAILKNKLELTTNKQTQPKSRNRKTMKAIEERTSAPAAVSDALRTFCIRFLNTCYNTFMQNAKMAIGHMAEEDKDDQNIRYFWALRFFSAFARVHNIGLAFVSETVSIESLHFVHSKILDYTDTLVKEKQQIALWSNRAHVALKAFQEILMTLALMSGSPEDTLNRASKQIVSNLLYVPEYREISFKLLREFNETKYSRAYLKDVVVAIHILLKLMEVFFKSQQGQLFVKKKQRITKKTDELDHLVDVTEDGLEVKKQRTLLKEVHFELEPFIKRFAVSTHIEPYIFLLKDCSKNTVIVNHAVLKMLHRIAVDLTLPGMLFRMSLFRLYQRILKDKRSVDPCFYEELRPFMQFILEKFFEKMREDSKAILTTLF